MKKLILKFKKWLIALGIVGVASAAVIGLQPSDIALVQTDSIKKTTSVHMFKDNLTNEIYYIETTKVDYDNLNVKSGIIPTYPNSEWVGSSANMEFYPSLKDYQYKIVDSTTTPKALIKLPNQAQKKIDTQYISDNKLTSDELTLINQ